MITNADCSASRRALETARASSLACASTLIINGVNCGPPREALRHACDEYVASLCGDAQTVSACTWTEAQ